AVTGALAFAADGTAAFAAGKGVTGAITNTMGADGKGTLTIVGTTDVAFGGQIGASGASLKAANITITDADADAATFAGKVYALAIGITGNADDTDFVDFADDVVGTITITTGGTVELAANKTITGDFKSAANSVGELNVLAATTVGTTAIVTGNVGIDGGHKIEELDVITGATATVIQSITGKVDAVAVNVTGTGTLAFGGAVDATNVNAGTVSFLTFAEDLTGILNLNVAATGTFAANKKVVGSVDTSGTAGILTFEATTATTTYVDGTVGTTGALDAINVAPAVVSGTAIVGTFGNTVAATLLTHSGAGTVAFAAATAIPTINLTGDGKISFASGIGHTGAITTGTTNTGSIDFVAGNQAVSGTVGASGALIKQITQVGGSGTLTFNDDVFATQLTINSTGGVTMGTADDLNANVYFDADGTLTLHTDGMTGDVTTQTGNTGTVVAGQNMTITGNLGTSDLILKMVDVGAAVTITGTVYATEVDIAAVALSMSADADIIGAVDFSAAGTLNLADGADVTGTIIPSAGNHGTVNVAGTRTISGVVGNVGSHDLLLLAVGAAGKLTLGGGFEGTQITVASGGVLNYTSATTAHTGNLVVTGTGTVNVGTTTTTVSGTLTMPATSTFKVTIGDTNGKLIHSTAASAFIATNGLLEPVIAGRITSGTAITVFAGAAAPNLPSVTDNYERYSFLLAVCNTNDLCLTPTLVTPAGVSANSAAVSAIADIAFAADSTMNDAIQSLSGAALDKALETLAPAVSGGAIAGAVSAGGAAG
ncbi:MAG: hypothetical protein NZ738_03455, partial [Oceanospirillaceae bacterium]|nr:hypothetical protein [Oceanospirillaceae bacterium]